MKVFISADIEGVTGIAAWEEARKDAAAYAEFRHQMTAEVAAACEGALEAGATEILVKDAHGSGRNIIAAQLPRGARLIRGWSGHPQMMMQELDPSFDAVMMIGYHSAASSRGNPLGHSFSSARVYRLMINGVRASEFLCNTYTAHTHKVPVVYVSGDKALCAEVSAFNPSIHTTAVNEGIGDSTLSLQPDDATALIKTDARKALTGNIQDLQCALPDHFEVELSFKDQAPAYKANYFPGAVRKDDTTVGFESRDYFDVLTFLMFVIY